MMLPVPCPRGTPWHTGRVDETALIEELLRRGGDELDQALELVGLYVEDKSIVGRDGPDGPEFAIAMSGTLGRIAFSPRVQDPEGTAIDEVFSGLTERLEKEAGDDTHDRFRQRLADLHGHHERNDPGTEPPLG